MAKDNLSSDHDPLYRAHCWQADLRILDVTEIKTAPYVTGSPPLVERFIGTLRRQCRDRSWFWTTADLKNKLLDFQAYFDLHRTPTAREGRPPTLRRLARSRTYHLVGGHRTVEAWIKHRSLPDSEANQLPAARRGGCHVRRLAMPKCRSNGRGFR